LQALDRPILLATLRGEQGVADVRLDRFWNVLRSARDEPIQNTGLDRVAASPPAQYARMGIVLGRRFVSAFTLSRSFCTDVPGNTTPGWADQQVERG